MSSDKEEDDDISNFFDQQSAFGDVTTYYSDHFSFNSKGKELEFTNLLHSNTQHRISFLPTTSFQCSESSISDFQFLHNSGGNRVSLFLTPPSLVEINPEAHPRQLLSILNVEDGMLIAFRVLINYQSLTNFRTIKICKICKSNSSLIISKDFLITSQSPDEHIYQIILFNQEEPLVFVRLTTECQLFKIEEDSNSIRLVSLNSLVFLDTQENLSDLPIYAICNPFYSSVGEGEARGMEIAILCAGGQIRLWKCDAYGSFSLFTFKKPNHNTSIKVQRTIEYISRTSMYASVDNTLYILDMENVSYTKCLSIRKTIQYEDRQETQNIPILQVKKHHCKEHFIFIQTPLSTDLYDIRNPKYPVIRWFMSSNDFNPHEIPNLNKSPTKYQLLDPYKTKLYSFPTIKTPFKNEDHDEAPEEFIEIEHLFTISKTSTIDCFQYSNTVAMQAGNSVAREFLILQDKKTDVAFQKIAEYPTRIHLLPVGSQEYNGRDSFVSIPFRTTKKTNALYNDLPFAVDIEVTTSLPLIQFHGQSPVFTQYSSPHQILTIIELSHGGDLCLQQFYVISQYSSNDPSSITLGKSLSLLQIAKDCKQPGKRVKMKQKFVPDGAITIRPHRFADMLGFSAFEMRKRPKLGPTFNFDENLDLKSGIQKIIKQMDKSGVLKFMLKQPLSLYQIAIHLWERMKTIRAKLPCLIEDNIYYIVYKEFLKFLPNEMDRKMYLISYIIQPRYFGKPHSVEEAKDISQESFPEISHRIYYWEERAASSALGSAERDQEILQSTPYTIFFSRRIIEVKQFSTKWELIPEFKEFISKMHSIKGEMNDFSLPLSQRELPTISPSRKELTPALKKSTSALQLTPVLEPSTPALAESVPEYPITPVTPSNETEFDLSFDSQTPSFPKMSSIIPQKASTVFPPRVQTSTAKKTDLKKKRVAGF